MPTKVHAHLLLPLGVVACSHVDSCFVKGTLVDTPAGPRAIETLQVGEMVWSFSLERRERVARRVTAVLASNARETRRIEAGGRIIAGVTPSHPFYDVGRGIYREARDLKVGDLLAVGEQIAPRAIERIEAAPLVEPAVPVFNLTIDGPESNYFAAGVLVHNKQPPSPPPCHGDAVQISEHRESPDGSFADRLDGGATSSTGDFDVAWSSDPGTPFIKISVRIGSEWTPLDAVVTKVTPTLHRVRLERLDPGDYELAVHSSLRLGDASAFCGATATHRFSINTASGSDASTMDVTPDASTTVGEDGPPD